MGLIYHKNNDDFSEANGKTAQFTDYLWRLSEHAGNNEEKTDAAVAMESGKKEDRPNGTDKDENTDK